MYVSQIIFVMKRDGEVKSIYKGFQRFEQEDFNSYHHSRMEACMQALKGSRLLFVFDLHSV